MTKIGEVVKGSKWGVGGIFLGVGLFVLTEQVPHTTPGLQEVAGGIGLTAFVAGVIAIVRRYAGTAKAENEPKDGASA